MFSVALCVVPRRGRCAPPRLLTPAPQRFDRAAGAGRVRYTVGAGPFAAARWPPLTRFVRSYTLAFAIISVVATIADREVRTVLVGKLMQREMAPGVAAEEARELARKRLPHDPLYDTISFLTSTAANLIQLMFASLSGRYVVSLFSTAQHHGGYVLFLVIAATVLLRRASASLEG